MKRLDDSACHGMSRRQFLRTSAVGATGLSLVEYDRLHANPSRETNCIILFLTGGPSQLDTWDPKPNAPERVRGPFRSCVSKVPGIRLAETFPLMAQRTDRFALVRSVHHDLAPIHETGQQLVQTGRFVRSGIEQPHYGSVLSALRGPRGSAPPFVVLPTLVGDTGVPAGHGQTAGQLGTDHEPILLKEFDLNSERARLRQRYGPSPFGQSCLTARRLIEAGTRCVTVNMFDTVFDQLTWDCHAAGGSLATTLDDYRRVLCPMFDTAYTALLDDLADRGMLDSTLVVAMGEFGRTPELNPRGGRDHWPGCWTVLLAGGGVRGGQVVGASDGWGAEPAERPVTCAELAATIYHALGINPDQPLPTADGTTVPLADAQPVLDLFC